MHRSTTEPWADYVWNPITGCLKDCEFCHLKSQYKRFSGDIRYNRSLKDRYAVENNTFVLDQKFTSPKGGTLSFPFRGQPTYHRYRLGNLDQLKAGLNKNALLIQMGNNEIVYVDVEFKPKG